MNELGHLIVAAAFLTVALIGAGLTVAFLLDWATGMSTTASAALLTLIGAFFFLLAFRSAFP